MTTFNQRRNKTGSEGKLSRHQIEKQTEVLMCKLFSISKQSICSPKASCFVAHATKFSYDGVVFIFLAII